MVLIFLLNKIYSILKSHHPHSPLLVYKKYNKILKIYLNSFPISVFNHLIASSHHANKVFIRTNNNKTINHISKNNYKKCWVT